MEYSEDELESIGWLIRVVEEGAWPTAHDTIDYAPNLLTVIQRLNAEVCLEPIARSTPVSSQNGPTNEVQHEENKTDDDENPANGNEHSEGKQVTGDNQNDAK